MKNLFSRNKKYVDITIPAGLQSGDGFSLRGLPYNRNMPGELAQVLTELSWQQIKTEIENALNGEETLMHRKAVSRRMTLSVNAAVPTMGGFVGGFLMTFFGAEDGNAPLLAGGIVCILICVYGIGCFIYNGAKLQEVMQGLKRTGLEAINGGLIERLEQDYPLLNFELVNLDNPGLVCTIRISLSHVPVAAVVESSSKEPIGTKYTV